MSSQSKTQLNPYEAAALTRLLVGFCLGRGSICVYSRSYVLQIPHKKRHGDYVDYQWRRLCQFIPTVKPPKLIAMKGADSTEDPSTGQWRLRVSSRWFETAYNLLYPRQEGYGNTDRLFTITPEALSLVGAEALGCLWADRARVFRGKERMRGQLNVSRISFEQAQLVDEWIRRLTGAGGRLDHSQTHHGRPMLYYQHDELVMLLSALRPTWMGQSACLADKFALPPTVQDPSQSFSPSLRLEEPYVPPVRRRHGASRRKLPEIFNPANPPVLNQRGA